jgi:hypothetical protein
MPIQIGTYRPDDAEDELDIKVRFPQFWFDDQTGDYQANDSDQFEPQKLAVPLTATQESDVLSTLVKWTFEAGLCVPAEMGVHPTTTDDATESMTK